MSDAQPKPDSPYDPLQPLGVFLLVFGLVVTAAVFVEMPAFDRLINLVAGLTVAGIGAGFWWVGHRRMKKLRQSPKP